METRILKESKQAVIEAAKIIKAGGVVIIPTETVYGLAANGYDSGAVCKIFAAKGRPQDNPLILHVCEIIDILPLVKEMPSEAKRLFEKFSPGPLTVVMEKSERVPSAVSAGLDTVAVRIPENKTAREIIKESGVPLAAPSANISGRPSPTRLSHLSEMKGRVPLIVDGGECAVGVESTVIGIYGGRKILLRPGGISREEIEKIIGEIEVAPSILDKFSGEAASSPGMKYRHYAPSAEMFLGEAEKILQKAKKGECLIICYEEDKELFEGYLTAVLGRRDDFETQAQRLYDILREADKRGVKQIYAQTPSKKGKSLAIYNRMIKAAGHKEL